MQPVVLKRLQGAYANDRLAHAYLLEGPSGSGKKELTHFFVKLLLCETPIDNVPCETCRSCKLYESGNHPNILFIEPDGQNIKIDQIRDLIYTMNKTALNSGRKIYVIEQADRMNNSSANALLKFLEEPARNRRGTSNSRACARMARCLRAFLLRRARRFDAVRCACGKSMPSLSPNYGNRRGLLR